jgi:DNA-binding IclR family transcriptional regulator
VPARHHRTVDRVTHILDLVAREPHGMSLKYLTEALDAPKSSVQELTNGLVATGYLIEQDRRFYLGPAPFVLTLISTPIASIQVRHEDLVALNERVQASVLLAIQVGDSYVHIDQVGDSPRMEYIARTRTRRPLLDTASGMTFLANLPTADMHRILRDKERTDPEAVERFLHQLPAINETGLAYNRARTAPDVYAVATGVYDISGNFVAALSSTGGAELAPRLEHIGKELIAESRRWRTHRTAS